MIDHIKPEIDLITGIGIILEILLEMKILNKRSDTDIIIPGIDLDGIIILAVNKRSIGKQPAVENMIPPERRRRIPIIYAESISKTEIILSKIPGQIKMVFRAELVIRLGIDIIKIKTALLRTGIPCQFEERIRV